MAKKENDQMKHTYDYVLYGEFYTKELTDAEKEELEKTYGVVCIRKPTENEEA